ncbi:AmmeMemoRadiSam system protein B [Candidatus Uhrbacteria bacterium]|jgi:aromatic ring-opening dioxygenase LigB subunit|nr:MAG: AmmeMemoRadiSam system protein B [Candidatus Uhrbacteria bacterium]
MIVLAAIVPHSPLLAPTIGKEHREKLSDTLNAFEELSQSLYLAKPDTIVILSPHAPMYPDAFSGNIAPTFKGSLKEFGDHGTELPIKADFLLLDHIHRHMRDHGMPFTMTSAEELDYATTIPLLFLNKNLPNVKLIPIGMSGLDIQKHYAFGEELKNVLHAESRRVAIIASADLSHTASNSSPEGLTEEGMQFDKTMREKSLSLDAAGMLSMDAGMLEKAKQSGHKPIVTLMGCLKDMNCKAKELSYEAPFGVGMMTVRYDLA